LGLEYLHQEGVIYRYTLHSNQHSSQISILLYVTVYIINVRILSIHV
jgi:hypothetical protein